MRPHALELRLDAAGDDVVRRDWRALRDAGLPSQLDHRGPSNAPHLTLAEAARLTDDHEARARELLDPLLPRAVEVGGLVVLGGRRATLARLVDADDELTGAVLALRAALGVPQRHPGWLPHVTLARRLPRGRLADAIAVLPHDHAAITLKTVHRWDPDAKPADQL